MKNLLLKPNNNSKKKFDITPQSAHWKYVGFKLFHLEKGDDIKDKTNFEESIVVFIEGYGEIEVSGKNMGELGSRTSVFEKKPPSGFYIPLQTPWSVKANTKLILAVCSAPGKEEFSPSIIKSDEIKLIERGKLSLIHI